MVQRESTPWLAAVTRRAKSGEGAHTLMNHGPNRRRFRSAILHQMLVLWSESSRMIVFAECAVSCKAVSAFQFESAGCEARTTITGRLSAFPDARPKAPIWSKECDEVGRFIFSFCVSCPHSVELAVINPYRDSGCHDFSKAVTMLSHSASSGSRQTGLPARLYQ